MHTYNGGERGTEAQTHLQLVARVAEAHRRHLLALLRRELQTRHLSAAWEQSQPNTERQNRHRSSHQ
jgi:hypothetical protein